MSETENVPRWVWRLIYRLGKLERGKVYRLTVIMLADEPVWTVEAAANLENLRQVEPAQTR